MPESEKISVALMTHADGAHVSAYITALAASDVCESVVLSDPDGRWDAEAKRKLGDRLKAVYRNHEQMLAREQPTLALITYEARLAPQIILHALRANCHVFAEKPSCVRVADFEPLVREADSRHRHLMLALANRLNPEAMHARRLIARGEIGKVYGLEMHLVADQTRLTRKSYQQQWFTQKARAGGGHLIWLGIHWLDLAMHVTDASITSVSGFTANVGGQPIDVEDSAAAALQFDDGFLGTVTSGYYLDKGYHSHIKIWGSKGWLHLAAMRERPLHWSTTKGPASGKIQEFTQSKDPRGYTPYVHAALRAAAGLADPPISNAHSLRALKTVFAIYDSAESGKRVNVTQ